MMKTILVLGAGRSSASLISYLLHQAPANRWRIIVGDASYEMASGKVGGDKSGKAVRFNLADSESVALIGSADIVISLLPPNLHPRVAAHCLSFGKHLLTASYVSDEMNGFDRDAKARDLIFLNECGLDPGIDHMSALQVLDRIRGNGGEIISFESFTGGLIAPDTDPKNPWRYKFTWNPRNVVMAGQGTAKFLQHGNYKFVPYQQLFRRITPVHVPGYGDYEGYANRDSLKYIDQYNLKGIRTMVRGTLRNKGFCSAWNVFVQLGCCDDSYEMEGVHKMTHADFLNAFLEDNRPTVEEKIRDHPNLQLEGHEVGYLKWSGFFDPEPIGLPSGTPAQVLEHILNKKWKLSMDDKDQIVMWHRFVFQQHGSQHEVQASLVATGKDSVYTAMAETVGLPLGIAAKLVLNGQISARGVVMPTTPEFYNPILKELGESGIVLQERVIL